MSKHFIASLVILFLLIGAGVGFTTHYLLPDGERQESPIGDEATTELETENAGTAMIDTKDTSTIPVHESFNVNNAMSHIYYLSANIGERVAGTAADRKAADYIHNEFAVLKYEAVREQSFLLKNGLTSYNVYVEDIGSKPTWTVIVGAHYDTPGGKNSPGANDNASGVGAVLELARVFKANAQIPTLRFVAFGAEEITQGYTSNDHHYGSRYMASQLGSEGINVIGMMSIDMIGVGPSLTIYATLKAPKTFLDLFYGYCAGQGITLNFIQDKEWSDHESFEQHGISSFWIEFRPDPYYHSPNDTYDKIDYSKVNQVGKLIQGFLESLDANTCEYLDTVSNFR